MANLANNDVLQIRIVCFDPGDSQLGECVFHVLVSAVSGNVTDGDVASKYSIDVAAAVRAWIGGNATYEGVGCKRIRPNPTPEVYNNGSRGSGTAGGVCQPTQVTALLRHKSDQFYVSAKGKNRLAQGRLYVPFPSLIWVGNPDLMSAAGLAALNAVGTAIGLSKTIVGVGGGCVCSLGTNVTEGPGPVLTKNLILSGTIAGVQMWATQRRRGQYGKPNNNPFA